MPLPLPWTGGGEYERSFVRNEDEYGFADDDHDDVEYFLKKVASEILRRESSSMPDESKTVICGRGKVQ